MRQPHAAFTEASVAAIRPRLQQMNAQDLTNVIWSAAHLRMMEYLLDALDVTVTLKTVKLVGKT